ncbi:MAG: hypothetical protein DRP81_02985 [Candidatus Omnitrophota bacterium]|nr:MAG: hypothetical protein DRP81_02985 [Candidatus Omnitrophota bacterium]HDN86300.1 pyridoxamine 5'-phosphate oxidase family protein [Candidatus Omnitrophota bacterium]
MVLSPPIFDFFSKQQFVIVNTLDEKGFSHASCKGIVKIEKDKIHLLDLYKGNTYQNIKRNKKISIVAVDGEKFRGYCLKGYAKILNINRKDKELLAAWDKNVARRLAQRIISHIRKEKVSFYYPEASLPRPQFIYVVEVKEIIDLVPKAILK